ncbi:MAG: putative maturation protein [Wruxavirus allofaecicola]|uniref:Maturation protein n=1 Tax=Leviviridae sp. TaxID=2027243 RepID=A0ABY3SSE3_9VIRU|nr:MAG: putative maturation protein [Leviviridae sp.]
MDHDFALVRYTSEVPPLVTSQDVKMTDVFDYGLIRNWIPDELQSFYGLQANFESFDTPSWGTRPSVIAQRDLWTLFSPIDTLLARTNPSNPSTDLPSFVFEEIGGLPRLLHAKGKRLLRSEKGGKSSTNQLGRKSLKVAADLNLSLQFEWLPLIRDLKNLIDFGAQSSKKLRSIERLVRGKLKTKSILERHSGYVTDDWYNLVVVSDVRALLQDSIDADHSEFWVGPIEYAPLVRVRTVSEGVAWGTVTYAPEYVFADTFRRLNTNERFWLSLRAAYGLTWRNPAALWEIVPWSWLFDWFLQFQDVLQRWNNIIPVEVTALNYMTSQSDYHSFLEIDDDRLSFSPEASIRVDYKNRQVLTPYGVLPNPPNKLSLLDWRQLGLIASIVAQRVL